MTALGPSNRGTAGTSAVARVAASPTPPVCCVWCCGVVRKDPNVRGKAALVSSPEAYALAQEIIAAQPKAPAPTAEEQPQQGGGAGDDAAADAGVSDEDEVLD